MQAACVPFNMHAEHFKVFQPAKQVYVWDRVNSLTDQAVCRYRLLEKTFWGLRLSEAP